MEKKINMILVPQEYSSANHKDLWEEIGKKSKNFTIIIDIPADLVVTLIRRKFFRIFEAFKGPIILKENVVLLRPLYLLRPEVSPSFINSFNAKILKSYLNKIIPNIKNYDLNVLFYDGANLDLLEKMALKTNFYYYLLDEVRNDAHSDEINLKRKENDITACEKSNFIFLMSNKLLAHRTEYAEKIKVIGNGATLKEIPDNILPYVKSVGIIGNIRNWIDCQLLKDIIRSKPELHFGFVGNIEDNMKPFINQLIAEHKNVRYYGKVGKNEIHEWYKKFNVIIVPYIQNEFMMATRPIKIVEAIFAGTPVVTIPIKGYKETPFIKFASDINGFTKEIDYFMNNQIDFTSDTYKAFLQENSWEKRAEEIISEFK